MKAHLIADGKVVNTLEVDSLDFMPNLVEAAEGGIGWSYADGAFTPPADNKTDEEKAELMRFERNTLLKDTDHYALSDVTMSDAMKTYRQALRDVPQQSGFPSSITWPDKP